jgi:regulator of nucleoside diphosphate kinase
MALLGCREGDIVSWQTPSGTGSFRIDKVTYQPEAAGDYHL